MTTPRKKLIEVALPLDAINKASAREKSIRHGHPSTLHLWWARRPLAAARAVIFAQMVDDPSSFPDLFPTAKAQDKERQRLFRIIEELVRWESTTNDKVLQAARDEIWQSWRRTCAENSVHPRAKELFDRNKLPGFHDPFAGGGALPLEAQRLGLESYASDLNPVAVLINKAMIEIPPKFEGRAPVNPEARKGLAKGGSWRAAKGLAEDVRYYGSWMRAEAARQIGANYPEVLVTTAMAKERPELEGLVGKPLTAIAWIWARTVASPDPSLAGAMVPLASTFMLATKAGTEAYIEPIVQGRDYKFRVVAGKPKDADAAKNGTKSGRGNFRCMISGSPIPAAYIRSEGKAGRLGARLMALVAESPNGKIYLTPPADQEELARRVNPSWRPDVEFFQDALGFRVGNYGLTKWSDLFTERQLTALSSFGRLVAEARERVFADAVATSLDASSPGLEAGGAGAAAYADAVAVYLAFSISRMADRHSTLCRWDPNPTGFAAKIANTFGRQALSMVWDFAEGNPFSASSGNLEDAVEWVAKVVENALPAHPTGHSEQVDAANQHLTSGRVVSTDPPYFDNIGYADLSDFFYMWLRHALRSVMPRLTATVAVPKEAELVATPGRHGGRASAATFFLEGMTRAMRCIATQAHPAFPVTVYYAFKQSEADTDAGTASTGWETFLEALLEAGFAVTGTWPMRTELSNRMRGAESNALASSVVLVCRARPGAASTTTRRVLLDELRRELPSALTELQRGNIAPSDLAQAAIGPGMAVYTRYSRVLDAEGKRVPVREALSLINQILDESLAEQEGDFDADSRWALAWYEQSGFAEGEFGVADVLARAKNTAVAGLVEAGILKSSRGKVRLLKSEELAADWDPTTDTRLTTWEMVHHLIRALSSGGELAAAAIVLKLGGKAETARELAYRLYTLCERKKRAQEALAYNGLVQSWPEITRLAREGSKPKPGAQGGLFDKDGE